MSVFTRSGPGWVGGLESTCVVSMLVIRLLGRPEIERDGVVGLPPRGHKAWAVLAYLVLAERPVPRARLAGLVFADADDPLGALRWTLAQLRRALGADALCGDPLELALPSGGRRVEVVRRGGYVGRRRRARLRARPAALKHMWGRPGVGYGYGDLLT
jgi:hypothetical protein